MNQLRQLFFPCDDRKFFRMLRELSSTVSRGAAVFKDYVDTYEMLSDQERGQRAADIKELEHRCDELSHIIIMRLQREDVNLVHMETIQACASLLESIMDGISSASKRIILFHLAKTNVDLQQFALLVNNACKEVVSLIEQLHRTENIRKTIIRIHGIEKEADYVHALALSQLFATKTDARELIIFKDLYDLLENVVDQTANIARVVENMLAKDR